jgi:hypothetical protein
MPAELVAITILVVLAAPMAIPTMRKLLGDNSGFLTNLGFLSGPSAPPLAWGLALAVAAGYIGFAVKYVPAVARTWIWPSWSKLVVLAAAIAAATVEEAVFRRLVMDYVMQQGGGWALQVLASGVVFGLPHGIFGLIKRNAMSAFRAATITGVLGAFLGIVYLIGARSLAPCITAHFLITLALEPGLLIAAVTNEWRFETAPSKS